MRHRDDRAELVVDQRQPVLVRNDADPDKDVVDHALLLQKHFPCTRPHQKRGPERQQHEDQQQVRRFRRQVRQQVGDRVAEQHAHQRDHARHEDRALEQQQVDALLFRLCLDAIGRQAQVDGGEEVTGGIGVREGLDRGPDIAVAPIVIQVKPGLARRHAGKALHGGVGLDQQIGHRPVIARDVAAHQVAVKRHVDRGPGLFRHRVVVVFLLHGPREAAIGVGGLGQQLGGRDRQAERRPGALVGTGRLDPIGRAQQHGPGLGLFPGRVQLDELIGVILADVVDPTAGLAKQR
mmetsp:Transcript_3597/g.6551  ORF Transcript_3597/g.6551 Transcript_3597/m.6551 type:complete len:293 (+) Transcript_3597:266-1144(+)